MVRRASQSKHIRSAATAVVQALEDRRLLSISGLLDSAYGDNGVVTMSLRSLDLNHNYLVQNGDDLYAVEENTLFKLNPDGSLDSSFGQTGMLSLPQAGRISGVGFQDTGKIILSYYTTKSDNAKVYRYNANGSADISFGDLGVLSVARGAVFRAESLIMLPDDGFILGGEYLQDYEADPVLGLAILNGDGSVDRSFAGTGFVSYAPGDSQYAGLIGLVSDTDHVYSVVQVETLAGTQAFAVGKVSLEDGSLDLDYSSDGFSDPLDDGLDDLLPQDFQLDPAGRMFVSAQSQSNGDIYVLDAYGYPDFSIGEDGVIGLPSSLSTLGTLEFIIAPDQSILAADRDSWRVFRFDAEGLLDLSYDHPITTWGSGLYTLRVDDMAFLPSGKLLTHGVRTEVSSSLDQPILVRYAGLNDSGPAVLIDNPDVHPENRDLVLSSVVQTFGGRTVAKYEWDFDYDGIDFDVDSSSQSPVIPAGTYAFGIFRTFALRVTDSIGNVGEIAQKMILIGNSQPDASIALLTTYIYEGVEVTISLSGSDPDGVDSWRINWGDGNIEIVDGAPETASHVYLVSGDYVVRAQAVDAQGTHSEIQSLNIRVLPTPWIEGFLFNDINKDGVKDPGDDGISGQKVYLDYNSDGVQNAYTIDIPFNMDEDNVIPAWRGIRFLCSIWNLPNEQYDYPVLTLSLTAPDLTYIDATLSKNDVSEVLFLAGDVSGDKMTNTTFSYYGETAIWNGTSPYTGTYYPEGSMYYFLPLNPNGVWDLSITNNWPTAGDAERDAKLTALTFTFTFLEPQTTTDANGHYSFTNLHAPQATFPVTLENVPPGFDSTIPDSLIQSVTLDENDGVYVTQTANFGFYTGTAKTVTVFSDDDGDGVKGEGEEYLQDIAVYADLNANGQLDDGEVSALTDENGKADLFIDFSYDFLIRAVTQGPQTLTLNPQGTTDSKALFGISTRGSISGLVYYDDNIDGVRQSSESAGAGVTVYIDANDNGVLDAGETSTLTSPAGSFSFSNLPLDVYIVRVALPANCQVSPAGSASFSVDRSVAPVNAILSFPIVRTNIVSGVVYNDANADGARQSSEKGLSGITLYLDANNNGKRDAGEKTAVSSATGKYLFSNVSIADNLRVRMDESAWRSTTPLGRILAARQLNIGATQRGSVSGTLYVDSNNNKKIDSRDKKLSGATVFVDLNKNGFLDDGDLTAVSNSKGFYRFNFVPTGQYAVRVVRPPSYRFIGYTSVAFSLSKVQTKGNLNFLFKKL